MDFPAAELLWGAALRSTRAESNVPNAVAVEPAVEPAVERWSGSGTGGSATLVAIFLVAVFCVLALFLAERCPEIGFAESILGFQLEMEDQAARAARSV